MARANSTRNPSTWDEYYGRPSPSGSVSSNAIDEEQALLDDGDDNDDTRPGNGVAMGRRRSSVTNRLATIADIGGVNSFRSFARSWQRAADFHEVIPRRPSFVLASEQEPTEQHQYGKSPIDPNAALRHDPAVGGLLRQHLEASGSGSSSSAAAPGPSQDGPAGFRERENKDLDPESLTASGALPGTSPSGRSSIFAVPPQLATSSIIGSYSSYRSTSLYGTLEGTQPRRRRISIGGHAFDAPGGVDHDDDDSIDGGALGEHQPILVKEVKQGNKVVLTVEGQSTLPQSVFNSINAIIGVGLLSLPLAFKMSGWIAGLGILTLTAAVTAHTGKLLARCMDYDPSLITYSDVAYVSFGTRARIIVSALFTLELISACVALVILFADSLDLLLPGVASVNIWKCVAAVLVLALNAMPMRFLSYTSVVGIFSTFCIVCIVIIDGLIKPDSPGSLRQPAKTYLLPQNWLALPLAYGLLASPWGAHSVFPSIYRDMRHPYKWNRAVNITFSFSYVLDTCLAIFAILMFGDEIQAVVTSNIITTAGYPEALTVIMCICIAIIPLTKIPLNTRPIITTMDVLLGVHVHHHHHHHHHQEEEQTSAFVTQSTRGLIRVFVVVLLLVISIAFPAFDSVCAFLGAALCTLISILLPISFHLKLFWNDIPMREKVSSGILLIVFSILGILGTVWAFLPKHLIGAA